MVINIHTILLIWGFDLDIVTAMKENVWPVSFVIDAELMMCAAAVHNITGF